LRETSGPHDHLVIGAKSVEDFRLVLSRPEWMVRVIIDDRGAKYTPKTLDKATGEEPPLRHEDDVRLDFGEAPLELANE
jgi:hypothetical protein